MEMRMKVEDPGKIVYTLTATATAAEWDSFREALDFVANKSVRVPDSVYHFRSQIDDLLGQARKIYWPAHDSGDEHA